MPAPPQAFRAVPKAPLEMKPVGLTVHDLDSLRFCDRLCSMAVGCLRLILGIKDQRDPSIFTGLKVKTKAVWNHLDLINPHVHLESPSKNNNTDKRSIDRTIQFRYAVIAISRATRAVTRAARTPCMQCSKTPKASWALTNRRAYLCLPSLKRNSADPPTRHSLLTRKRGRARGKARANPYSERDHRYRRRTHRGEGGAVPSFAAIQKIAHAAASTAVGPVFRQRRALREPKRRVESEPGTERRDPAPSLFPKP